ncbi:MAG UNVERIFIED_CONTAM: hypothetical protein LVR29_26410 [Microcystis novacekii LVE1205-3]
MRYDGFLPLSQNRNFWPSNAPYILLLPIASGALRPIVTFKSKQEFWPVVTHLTFYYCLLPVVRYDGLLPLSQNRNFGRLTHPTFYYCLTFN